MKKDRLLREVQGSTIEVPSLPRHELINLACGHYNEMAIERDKPFWATPNSQRTFLDRICVNYLRHELSDYEPELHSVYGKVGATAARFEIRRKVYRAIAATYPDLAEECERQIQTRLGKGT